MRNVIDVVFEKELLGDNPWRVWYDLVDPAAMTDSFASGDVCYRTDV